MASLSDIVATLQNGVTAINKVVTQLKTSFPPITTLSTTAPAAGTLTYNSSQISAFGLVQTSSGGTYRIALLPSS
ncbi:MAG TPA: hypothetical protein VIY48_11125 [Candidatus Paceibacterota bacterium]